jgi:hypothetical protein
MIPMRHSWIFRSRWMALIWAAGIIWLALDVAVPDDSASNAEANATDVTGAPISKEDEKALADAINGL